jgi:hypothetical protein
MTLVGDEACRKIKRREHRKCYSESIKGRVNTGYLHGDGRIILK